MLEIISRPEAKLRGLQRYFTGKPCIHGHISERFMSGGCIECSQTEKRRTYAAAKTRLWKKANPERVRANEYRWRKEHTEQHRANSRRSSNRWSKTHPEQHRAKARRWAKENPDKKRASIATRRARLARPLWVDREALSKIYAACPPDMVVDHIVPLKGRTCDGYRVTGLHVPWNLQYLSPKENLAKNSHMRPEDPIVAIV